MKTERAKIKALEAVIDHLEGEIVSIIESNSIPCGDRSTLSDDDEEWVKVIEGYRDTLIWVKDDITRALIKSSQG